MTERKNAKKREESLRNTKVFLKPTFPQFLRKFVLQNIAHCAIIYTDTSGVFILEGIKMAKETVKVDNGLEEIKLVKNDKLNSKKEKRKEKEQKPKDKKKKTKEKEGFFEGVKNEMKLVTWPTKKNVFKYSFAAVLMVVFMAAFFLGISALFDLLYALVQGWIG